MKLLAFGILSLIASTSVFSKDIFVITKSLRDKNVIHYDINTTGCRMGDRALSAYWRLGEKKGKIQQLTPEEVEKLGPEIVREYGQELEFTLPALNELDNRLVENTILVRMVNCEPKAFIKISGELIELREIHAKISIFKMGIAYLLFKGKRTNGADFQYKIKL